MGKVNLVVNRAAFTVALSKREYYSKAEYKTDDTIQMNIKFGQSVKSFPFNVVSRRKFKGGYMYKLN